MPSRSLSQWARWTAGWLAVAGLVLLLAGAPATAQRPDRPSYYAIQNARIVPVSGPVIESGTVVIANGLIQAVGTDVTIPAEAWVIDGKGLTVYPGLIDSLSKVGLGSAQPQRRGRAAGGGAPGGRRPQQTPQRVARGPEDRTATTSWELAADKLNASDSKIKTWRSGGFTTAVTSPDQGIFPGQAAVINLAGKEPKDMVVKTPAALRITLNRARGGQYPGSLFGVIAYIRQLFFDAEQYAKAWEMYEANPSGLVRPDYDRTLAPLVVTKKHNRPVLLPGSLARQINRAVNLGAELGLRTVVYGGQEGYRGVGYLKGKGVPVLVNVKWPEKDKNLDPKAEESLRTLRYRDRAPSSPAEFQKAGIPFAFYSGGVASPKAFLKNVKKSIDAGLAADAALRALTLSAAEIFDVSDRIGSIEPGKIANLVVTDGDLFEEKTKIKIVFVDGEKFDIKEAPKPPAGKGDGKPGTLAGRWSLEVAAEDGTRQVTLDLSVDGENITGTVDSELGLADITKGTLTENNFSFTIIGDIGEGPEDITFSGTIEGDTITGTVSLSAGDLPFSGTRADPGASTFASQMAERN